MPRPRLEDTCVTMRCYKRKRIGDHCELHALAVESSDGRNHDAVAALRRWLSSVDDEAEDRFSAQLAMAATLAADLDAGRTTSPSAYRGLLADIYRRVDDLYGVQAVDAVARISALIKERAAERAALGWDG